MTSLDILHEDNHLLVVNKPAGIATMGADSSPTMHSLAAAYIKQAYHKPGRVFVGIVSRLDAMTSGALVMARTSKAASRLSAGFARQSGGPIKIYLALIQGHLQLNCGRLTDHLLKDDAARRMRVVASDTDRCLEAKLHYSVVAQSEDASLVAIRLLTGRKHQIRVQLADRGHAVIGDQKYGSKRPFPKGIALHSWQLQIEHPTRRQEMRFEAGRPKAWNEFGPLTRQIDPSRQRIFTDLGVSDHIIS